MSGNKLFIDSNILLYLLGGDETLAELLHEKQLYVSFVTELEVLGYPEIDEKEKTYIRKFLDECTIININEGIKESVIDFRRRYNVKLPDCIIASSAYHLGLPLITSDKGFQRFSELDILYYEYS